MDNYETDCSFEKVLEEVREHHKFFDEEMLVRAYNYAAKMHEGVFRRSGEPYITHPLRVAYTVAPMPIPSLRPYFMMW